MAPQQPRSGSGRKPSPEVYRRRRIVAGVALLVAVALIVWAVVAVAGLFTGDTTDAQAPASSPSSVAASPSPSASASSSAEASSAADASTSASSTASADASPAEAAGGECSSADIDVAAATDKSSYGSGDEPVLEMKITNSGSEDCTLNVGTSQQEFKIVSGSDRIFSTTDCRADATDTEMTLKAGATETARFTWDRQRSAPGCKDVSSKPRPGTYSFTAKLGDIESDKTTFTLK
ncbi:hypothetical protein [Arthrobacter sp. JSM 101049]|uniref:hypothetical protein n=1 Tax=Arthrobacter sp. JSM 101049 TaxID=929097 RepID=UPI00356A08A3